MSLKNKSTRRSIKSLIYIHRVDTTHWVPWPPYRCPTHEKRHVPWAWGWWDSDYRVRTDHRSTTHSGPPSHFAHPQHPVMDNIKLCYAELIWGNIKIYLYFPSSNNTNMAHQHDRWLTLVSQIVEHIEISEHLTKFAEKLIVEQMFYTISIATNKRTFSTFFPLGK